MSVSGDVIAVVIDDTADRIGLLRAQVSDKTYPALSARLPQAQAFERELFETTTTRPEGHPWLKPLRSHAGPHPFFVEEGPSIHEVAVGPVHAGIIEPGHFRFQCHGEVVHHLEVQLGYQHRGAIELFLRSSPARRMLIAESIAGDTAVGHALAHVQVIEALGKLEVGPAAQSVRAIALELERLSNHVGDLGALCNDVGYLPGASWFGRLRGEFLNMLMELTGNRFGRSLLMPGGVRFGISSEQRKDWLVRLARSERDLRDTAELMFATPSVCSRFEQTGIVLKEDAEALGLVGPVARASGPRRDGRQDHPFGAYRTSPIATAFAEGGDVMARATVRWLETLSSIAFVRTQLEHAPVDSSARRNVGLAANQISASLVEGWRGEIVHVALTSETGELSSYQIVDPSMHNWYALTLAMRGRQISDFPLCNKSFNLSYAGHDL